MSQFISLATAEVMTARYRNNKEGILDSNFQNENILPISETFGKEEFETLVNMTGCAGLRIYYGMDESLKIHAIIVAINANDEDILPPSNLNSSEEEEYIIDNGIRCPDIC